MVSNKSVSPIKKIIKDTRYYGPAKIIPGFLGFLAVIIYTRVLTPKEYGLYVLAITTISIVVTLSFGWLSKSILRYFEEYRQNEHLSEFISTIVNSLIGIVLILLVFWYSGIVLLRGRLDPNLIGLLKIGGLVILTQAGYTITLSIRQAAQEGFKYALYSILNALAQLLIAVSFLYFFHTGSRGILLGMVISAGSILLWNNFSFYIRWQIKISYFSRGLFKSLVKYGFPLIGVSVASLILASSDKYMVRYFLTAKDTGVYSAGYTISNAIVQFPAMILLLAAYPIIIETFEKKEERETSLLLNKILAVYFIGLAPVIFGITALSENIAILLGESFRKSYVIFPWIAAGAFCLGLTQYFHKPFELKKKTKDLFYLVLFTSILNIILNLFFIPKFGILGAAYATLISYFICLFSTWIIGSRIFTWSLPWRTIAKTILSSTIMYLILRFVMPTQLHNIGFLTIEVLLGAVCYFVILYLLREKNTLQGFKYILNYLRSNR